MSTPTMFNFLAVLIYEDCNFGEGWLCEEPRVYVASHPEIAYQMALTDGKEERYGRKFLGLSHLEEATEEILGIARSKKGNAKELVVEKEQLTAFQDSRWKGIPWDESELAEALREPPSLFEIDGLEKISWHKYTHAYGPALDLPKDMRRLVSSVAEIREDALWQMGGSIYHQGSIFEATAIAVPFLLQIASDHRLPIRAKIWELLVEIAKSSAIHPEVVHKNWIWKWEKMGPRVIRDKEMVEREISAVTAVRQSFLDHTEKIKPFTFDEDPDVGKSAKSIIQLVETPLSPFVKCSYCHGSGNCFCMRLAPGSSENCKRCNGTGKCHVCKGSGTR